MKRYSLLQASIVLCIIILAGCTRTNVLKVSKTNFTDQIDQFQNLEFTFNRDMVTDSMINKWDSTVLIKLEPPVEGKFKWTGKRDLTFSPAMPFAPNTDYNATLTKELLKFNKENNSLDDEVIKFHTPYLEVCGKYAFWSLGEIETDVEMHIILNFNYPVERTDVEKYFKLRTNNKELPFRVIPGDINTETELVALPSKDEKYTFIEITMAPGMKAIGSSRINPEPVTYTIEAPSQDKLDITEITAEFEEGMGIISVFTSQPVVMKGLRSQVSVDPSVDFEISALKSGFSLKGEFNDATTYAVKLQKGIKGVFGPELTEEVTESVTFGSLAPYIAFTDESGLYLTPGGNSNLGITIINIPKVKISVFRIFENNIQHYLRYGRQYDWYEDENNYYDSYNYSLNDDYGQLISTREFSTNALPKKGNLRLLRITPEDLHIDDNFKGIYLIKAESTDKQWLSDVQMLSYSDIGLIVKEGHNEVFVAARSIATTEPLEGVSIGFYSKNNQLMNTVVTGRDGIAVFKDVDKKSPGFKIAMVTARKGDDYNVLIYNRSQVELTRFEVGGKYTEGREYDAFIYGDRNLYRPGDSVHFNVVLRDFNMKTVTGFPVKIQILRPDGKDFLKKRVNVSSNGSAEFSALIPEKAITGTYNLEVLTVSDVLINSHAFKVEEFMPDRISVDLKADKTTYKPGDIMKLTITAMNLFGPPAAGRKVENELRLIRTDFRPKGYADKYNFRLSTKDDLQVLSVVNQTTTSDKGIALQEFSLPAYTNAGLFKGKVYSTVFDETGRPVNRLLEFNLYTQNIFMGISRIPGWLATSRPVTINMIALNEKEKPVAGTAKLEVILSRWETVIERGNGSSRYRSQKKESVLMTRQVNIGTSGAQFSYTPKMSGNYLIRLSLPGSTFHVEQSFYAYDYGNDQTTFMINKDGQTDITFDKEIYKPGETAKVLFKTPFPGELLVTIEQNKVLEYYTLTADNNGAVMDLKIKDEYLPNVYVTATLLRKVSEGGIPLTVAHGFNPLKVEKAENKLPVAIDAPESIRSNRSQKITVKTSPGAEVTIAVVDEGILQITDHKTADPYGYFYGTRALEVSSYDLFDELFPELSSKGSSTGGDQGFDLGKRLNPLTAKRVKLLSLWSGRKTAGSDGEVTFTAKIPQFSGAVRIMAVAARNHQFGSADKRMRVSDPVTISSSIPRFLSPGDEATVFVTISNTTSTQIKANLEVSAKQPLNAGKLDNSKITIPANSEARVSYTLRADNKMGISTITFKASTPAESFTENTDITVRPAVPLVKEAGTGILKPGETQSFKISDNFLKGSASHKLLLTNNPAGKLADHLEELIYYPYGCIEQTISAAFPQLFYNDLADLLKQRNSALSAAVNTNVGEAIVKVSAFQQYNGAVSTWPGLDNEVSWFNSAYAAHFLFEAERAGYTVDKKVTENLQRYLLEMVKQKPVGDNYYYDGTGKVFVKQEARREIFYSLYVLALSGKHHLPTMNYFKSRTDLLSPDSKYMLACTYKLAGDNKSFQTLLPAGDGFPDSKRMTGESYSSPLRDRAIALYTLVSSDPDNPQVALLARQVGDLLTTNRWYSTQERAFSVLALGRMTQNYPKGNVSATVKMNGKSTEFKDKSMIVDLLSNDATVTSTGKGTIFWYRETSGIPLTMKVKEEDRVLRVRRAIFTRSGVPVASTTFKQNDLLVVALYVSTNDGSYVDNVVITDLLPACFEIENSRLTPEREMDWMKGESTPDYIDIRDDRINIFTSATTQAKIFYYMVRVVNKGNYFQGAVGAEAMYNGQYYSYFGARKIKAE